MLLIAEKDCLSQTIYKNYLSTKRLFEGLDYVFAGSYRDAGTVFNSYEDRVDRMIVNHTLLGEETGADLIRIVLAKENPRIRIVRCSNERLARFYPRSIPWFCRLDGIRQPVDWILEQAC